jgi:DNA repair exonuclease SbcCD ATPase subunit
MTALSRTWPRLGAALSLTGLFALLFLPAEVWASRSTTTKSTSTWSSTGKVNRTEAPYNYSYSTDNDNGLQEIDAYVFSRDEGHWRSGSGSTDDWNDAEDVRARTNVEPLLWFRRGRDQYVITDHGILDRLAEALKPQEELGKRQGELGRRQGELGRLQGELGQKQGRLGRMQADVSRRQALLSARMTAASMRDVDTGDLERAQRDLQEQQNEISDLQSELGEQQSKLGERQAALGQQQAALGQEQARVSKEANRKIDALVREAMSRGLAKSVD